MPFGGGNFKDKSREGRIAPSDPTVEIEWQWTDNGVASGTSKIQHFVIQCYIDGVLKYTQQPVSLSTKSYSFKLNTADLTQKRGKTVVIKVRAVNGVGNTVEFLDIFGEVNTLPVAPSFNRRKTIIPSSGSGEVDVEIISQGSKVSFEYATSENGTRYQTNDVFSGPVSIPAGSDSVTYYFWAKNLEYSLNYNTVTFTKNPTPSVTLTFAEDTQGKCTLTALPVGGQPNSSYTFKQIVNGVTTTIATTTSTTCAIANPRCVFGILKPDTSYDVSYTVTRNDGVESTHAATATSFQTPIAILARTVGDVSTAPPITYFHEDIGVALKVNSSREDWAGMNFFPIRYSISFVDAELMLPSYVSSMPGYFAEPEGQGIFENYAQGDCIDRIIFMTSGGETFSMRTSNTAYKIYLYNLKLNSFTPSTFSPYTSQSLTLKLEGIDDAAAYGYSGSTAPPITITNPTKTSGTKQITVASSSLLDADQYEYVISGSALYSILDTVANTAKKIELTLSTTNQFDFTSQHTLELPLTFDIDPIVTAINYTVASNNVNIANLPYLKNSMSIRCSMTILAYSEPSLSFSATSKYRGANGDAWYSGTPTWTTNRQATASECNNAGLYYNKLPRLYQISELNAITIGETKTDHNNVQFICNVKPSNNSSSKQTISSAFNILGQWEPTFYITGASFEDEKLWMDWEVQDAGHSSSIKNFSKLYLEVNDESFLLSQDSGTKKYYVSAAPDSKLGKLIANNGYLTLYLRGTSAFHISYNSTQIARTEKAGEIYNGYVFYNVAPTVAYRENQLGINTGSIEGDVVLAVRAHSEKKMVDLRGISDDGVEHAVLLDLTTGKLRGLIIDCGEW